ncbi:hypothetical protein EJ06DRAFT_391149 [Trichodelitschia bisporula]|uniref:Zn(2)-C6 fungal-type domain-containing protein n=1 Tax=Trichodelitschia bisporula TaxID=703511 RepID=A0A6G1I001_9PEZI|nr:hypothetical protein EJ06DRAFT_391149 [Trichodelitschia bisporula]
MSISMSDSAMTPPELPSEPQPQKRKASAAGLDGNPGQTRAVKRRASKACQCCRARKVRCNVTEHGAPCTNCRLDEVECIVSESRRKKSVATLSSFRFFSDSPSIAPLCSFVSLASFAALSNSLYRPAAYVNRKWSKDGEAQVEIDASVAKTNTRKLASRTSLDGLHHYPNPATSAARASHDLNTPLGEHVPHSIYQSTGHRLNLSLQSLNRRLSPNVTPTFPALHQQSPLSTDSAYFSPSSRYPVPNLPYYIKPLPARIGPDEVAYLEKKGALTVPTTLLRNELLRAYIEFVHPYMPLIDLCDFIMIIESNNGTLGRISLILYQAVMFAGSAFVEAEHLHNAGYATRKEARKDFFQKTRLLYEFDYESDRVALVQALLLLTYYYETPDDQKDTWHWMGVATSVAHTIGLHRNPERSNMSAKKTKLWKRIWWSTYMRDRLIALGMRRPTRIKTEDYDVPMLTLDDFEIDVIPESVTCVPAECLLARDVEMQRQLAIMCIEKAKLCLCISHVLSKQYCVLNNNQGMVNDRTTMMLLPKKLDPETCEVRTCDEELQQWLEELPEEAKHRDSFTGSPPIDLNRALLHMVFYTTLSALHRPQVLPSAPVASPASDAGFNLLDCSRRAVRRAATAITQLAGALDAADMVRYLPTTGVTVLLPAIIIHLLDIKAPEEDTRRSSLRGFCQCMVVMGKLRDIYAAADYSTAFLEAAIRKAGIQIAPPTAASSPADIALGKMQPIATVEDLVNAGRRMDMTPPPDESVNSTDSSPGSGDAGPTLADEEVARRLETFLASTPPNSDHADDASGLFGVVPVPVSACTDTTCGDSGIGCGESTDAEECEHAHEHVGKVEGPEYRLFSTTVLPEFEQDEFDALLNFDAVGDPSWNFDDGGVHGFTVDMDWLGAAGAAGGV